MGLNNMYLDDDPGQQPGAGNLGQQAQGQVENAFTKACDDYV